METRSLVAVLALSLLSSARRDAQAQILGEPQGLAPALNGGETRDFVAVDLDGDGEVDLVLARTGADAVLLGDGTGRFDELHDALTAGDSPTYAAAPGDVDGDGDADLVFALDGPNALLRNDGSAMFSDASSLLPADADASRDVLLVDVDLDGHLDLVVANHGENRLALGDGSGAFHASPGALGGKASTSNAVLALDADQDGDPDLLFGNGTSSGTPITREPNQLLHNDGAGRFSDASGKLPATVHATSALAGGDVDADGDADVLVGNEIFFGTEQELYYGDGRGGFGGGVLATGLSVLDVALGDVEGDGDLDAYLAAEPLSAFGPFVGGSDQLLLNDGAGTFAPAPEAVPVLDETTGAALLLDLDGDADGDALLGGHDHLLLGDGTGKLVLDRPPLPELPSRSVAAGDVDGDGDLDVVLGNGQDSMFWPFGRQTLFLRNDGTGYCLDDTEEVMPPLEPSVELGYTQDMAFADVEGDGDADLFLGRTGDSDDSGPGLYLFGNLGGTFADWSDQVAGGGDVWDVELGDVDGDGDVDLVAAAFPFDLLVLNAGSGSFAAGSLPQPDEVDDSLGCSLGDVDGDGDLDLLLGNQGHYGGKASDGLYLNDGAALFTDASDHLPAEAAPTLAVALADLDQDGDADAVIGNQGDGMDRLYENPGTGWFVDATSTKLPPSGWSESVAAADFDGDGWSDLLLGGRLLHNHGGVFRPSDPAPDATGGTASVALGDLDGDDDLDVVVQATPPRLWRNLARQTARRGPPRIGKPFALEIRGTPLGACVAAVAQAAAEFPLPPFGTLYLDPRSMLVLGRSALDTAGRSVLVFRVPPDRSAVGQRLHWQALVLPELLLTNRDAVSITSW